MGKVYLVGAGCGDLDLYTLKALRCIQKADCLVYDHLVDDTILENCKAGCEKIYVGKKAHQHTMQQEDINQLLVDKARQVSCVVRLKGGDVYVFGRGGEEGQVLFENGIDFEVVPGVSSATAGLAYAGIPITHRGISGGFQVYTAQLKHNQERTFDFTKMLDNSCTYVFLMGMSKLAMIVQGFLEAGKDQQTPVAIISNASLPAQKTLVGTLTTILDQFAASPLPTPGLIVVGSVVSMRQYLNFYERKPLFGKHILVTTVGQDHELSTILKDAGADVSEIMTGKIEYLKADTRQVSGWLVFTSQHGVHGFMASYLQQHHDIRALANTKIIAIGKKTNDTLKQYGLSADDLPESENSVSLDELLNHIAKDEPVFYARGRMAANLSCPHENLIVYENIAVDISSQKAHYDYGFFTCASAVLRFHQASASEIDIFVSIGPKTTQAIRECYGQDAKIIEAHTAAKKAMAEACLKEVK